MGGGRREGTRREILIEEVDVTNKEREGDRMIKPRKKKNKRKLNMEKNTREQHRQQIRRTADARKPENEEQKR